MYFWSWVLFGAVIGSIAGVKRGFSPVVGLAVGAFLGIFSPLLFVVSGLTKAGDLNTKTCPHCAERVKAAAKVCKHCGRDLAPGASGPPQA